MVGFYPLGIEQLVFEAGHLLISVHSLKEEVNVFGEERSDIT
jgi:hypothetical protein